MTGFYRLVILSEAKDLFIMLPNQSFRLNAPREVIFCPFSQSLTGGDFQCNSSAAGQNSVRLNGERRKVEKSS